MRARADPPPRRGGATRIVLIVVAIGLVAAAIAFAFGSMQGGSELRITPVDGTIAAASSRPRRPRP